ncbi:MAG: hypothetical protein R6V28_14775, partial [Nitriliruptoraceae bacterium]
MTLKRRVLWVATACVFLVPTPAVAAESQSRPDWVGEARDGGELEGELSQRSSVDADSRDLIFNATVSNVIWVAQPVWSVGEPGTNFGLCRGWRYVAATSEEEA